MTTPIAQGPVDVNVRGADTEAKILITVKFGHIDLRSWLEVQGDKIVGMGSATEYDENGRIVSHKVEPTGLVARYA